MPNAEPLTASLKFLWRALRRVIVTLPRELDREMVQATGMTVNEWATIVNVSEAPNLTSAGISTPAWPSPPRDVTGTSRSPTRLTHCSYSAREEPSDQRPTPLPLIG
jgi:hypothetical protein